jgi:hypothetical protein
MTAFTQLVSLEQMENEVRRITARYDEAQMSTAQVDYYINLAYTLRLPEQFRNIKLTKPYVFLTTPNVDTYDFIYEENPVNANPTQNVVASPGAIQINPPVYCQGYLLRYWQDKSTFYNRWPNLSVNQIINSGGKPADTDYTGFIPSTPFYRGQLDIFGNVTEAAVIISASVPNVKSVNSGFVYTLTDVPQPNSGTPNIGLLVEESGLQAGTVNYLTGEYHFIPLNDATIPSDAVIYAAVVPYQPSRPTDMLFYNQQLVLRPCPLQVYQIEFQTSQQPVQLLASGDAPELNEWWQFVCLLAAELIYTDFPDPEGMAYIQPLLDKQRSEAQRRTLRQLSTQRAQTIFSAPGWARNVAGYFTGNEYSGVS